ncbi:MAG: prolyl oligopeptidase family serine peptidase [Pirellulales bacterium]
MRSDRPLLGIPLAVSAIVFVVFANAAPAHSADEAAAPGQRVELHECLAVGRVTESGRTAIRKDPVEAMMVSGAFTPPQEGDELTTPRGDVTQWQHVEANEEGFRGEEFVRGYAYFQRDEAESRIAILEAAGHSMTYVNGVPRTGDVYSYGTTKLPVALKQGTNELLFATARGGLSVALVSPEKPLFLDDGDNTLPDLIVGEDDEKWGAIIVVNATNQARGDLSLVAAGPDGVEHRVPVGPVLPLGTRKSAFRVTGAPEAGSENVPVKVRLETNDGTTTTVVDERELQLGVVAADDVQKRTFVSTIDGSVQYYAVRPARPVLDADVPPAMILSLHGASVEALGQAKAYSSKSWGHIVAPTNRRPYGFDWEDWGERDAIEVLDLAQERYQTDPQRVYLTGHSMGGHGTWIVGATHPARFAAIGPSAGWISFWTYASRSDPEEELSPVAQMLQRASAMSRPRLMSRNYLQQGIYVLHGDADDNVPVEQARTMPTWRRSTPTSCTTNNPGRVTGGTIRTSRGRAASIGRRCSTCLPVT